MGVESVAGYNNVSNNTTSTEVRNPKSTLDQDDFIKLLLTQLQNQDPLSPMEDTDFIAQMAQFTSLQEMSALNSSFDFSSAVSLIGKTVNAKQTVDNETSIITGMVEKVSVEEGKVYATVNNTQVLLENILQVLSNKENEEDV